MFCWWRFVFCGNAFRMQLFTQHLEKQATFSNTRYTYTAFFLTNICEKQPEEGERGWLPVTLEKCLGALSILQNN